MIKLKSVKIGNTLVPRGLFLAPMAGFTDLEFRELCHECGAEFSVTEMISAKAVCFGDKKTWELARLSMTNATAIQLFGHDPEDIETACKRLLQTLGDGCDDPSVSSADSSLCTGEPLTARSCDHHTPQMKQCRDRYSGDGRSLTDTVTVVGSPYSSGEAVPKNALGACRPVAVDLNMGCPVKKIVSSGDGSALMRDPELCRKLVSAAVRGSGDVPVTVKIRAGFDSDHKNAAEVARAAVAGGASAVFVHGRTREQFYAPSSDNAVIAAVRDALPPEIPVIGNGDITSVEDADRMLRETGCDGIMIGRAALGDPWLFGRIAAAGEGVYLPEPTIAERLAMARRLCRAVCERYGEARGVPMCRGRAGHFIRGISGAAAMRDRLCHAVTLAQVEEILTCEP